MFPYVTMWFKFSNQDITLSLLNNFIHLINYSHSRLIQIQDSEIQNAK